MDPSERFVALALQARALPPDVAARLLLQARAAGRPAWELAAGGIGVETTARLLGAMAVAAPRYQLVDELGRGGMGRVLRVRDLAAGREVAQKLLLDEATPESRARFVREARVTAQLEHPGIVPVYEVAAEGAGEPYFVMKMVQGRSLKDVLDAAREDLSHAEGQVPSLLRLLLKVCEAVAYAHSRGVVHRDLKPANIMVGAFGEVLVMDWGLARVRGEADIPTAVPGVPSTRTDVPAVDVAATGDRTQDGAIVGTPAYMAPEQAEGRHADVDERTDVYALGAVLFELLALRAPFVAPSMPMLLKQVFMDTPPRPSSIAPRGRVVARELDAIALKALAKDPRARYANTVALAEDIERFLEGHPVSALPASALTRATKWVGRNAQLAASVGSALLLVLGVGLAGAALLANAARETARLAGVAARNEGEARAEAESRRAAEQSLREEAESRQRAEHERTRLIEQANDAARRRAAALDTYLEVAELIHVEVPMKVRLEVVIPTLQRSLEQDPTFAQAQLDLGYAYITLGKWDTARAELLKAVELGGERPDPRALYYLGETEFWRGRREPARAAWERLLAVAPGHVLGRLARTKLEADPADELRLLEALADEVPYRGEVVAQYAGAFNRAKQRVGKRTTLAEANLLLGRLKGAAENLRLDGFMRHFLMRCHLGRADVLESLGRYDEALDDALAAERAQENAIRSREHVFGGLVHTARLLLIAGREREGLRRIDAALELHPRHAYVHLLRGLYLLSRGAVEQARADLDIAQAGAPKETPPSLALEAEANLGLLIAAAETGALEAAAASADRLSKLLQYRAFNYSPFELPDLEARLTASVAAVTSWRRTRGEGEAAAKFQAHMRSGGEVLARVASSAKSSHVEAMAAADVAALAYAAAGELDAGRRYELLRRKAIEAMKGHDDRTRCLRWLRGAVAANPLDTPQRRRLAADDHFNLAAGLATIALERHGRLSRGVQEEVLSTLEAAADRGLDDPKLLGFEVLTSLRKEPRFQAVVQKVEAAARR